MIIIKNGNSRPFRVTPWDNVLIPLPIRDRHPVNSFFTINFKYSALSLQLHRVIRVQLFFTRKGDETSSFNSYYRMLKAPKVCYFDNNFISFKPELLDFE